MKKETKSIAFACGISLVIGIMLTLAISMHFHLGLWPLPFGAAVFGLLAYILFAPAEFWQGFKKAFSEACHEVSGYKMPSWRIFKVRVVTWFSFLIICATCIFFVSLVLYTMEAASRGLTYAQNDLKGSFLGLVAVSFILSLLFSCMIILYEPRDEEETKKRVTGLMLMYGNPYSLIAWLILLAFKATFLLLKLIKEVAVHTFFYVHSEERRICFVDTAVCLTIGFLFGYHYESVLAGTFLGTTLGIPLGILNYEIVSVRWLKLKQKET